MFLEDEKFEEGTEKVTEKVSSGKVLFVISLLLFIFSFVLFYISFVNVNIGENTIIARLNDTNISRKDIGEEFVESENQVISNYIYDKLFNEFYKDIEITDEDLDIELDLIRSRFTEEEWNLYLNYYGGGSEDTLKEIMRPSLKQEAYISKKQEAITLTDEEILAEFNKNPNTYNNISAWMLYPRDEETLAKAVELVNQGKTIQEISEELDLDLEDHLTFTYVQTPDVTWNKDLATVQVGDMIYTTPDSSTYVVGQVGQVHLGLEDEVVRTETVNSITYNMAAEEAEKEYIDYLKQQKVKIFGEDYPLYTEENQDNATEDNATEENKAEGVE